MWGIGNLVDTVCRVEAIVTIKMRSDCHWYWYRKVSVGWWHYHVFQFARFPESCSILGRHFHAIQARIS